MSGERREMNCSDAREALLEADLDQLMGRGEEPLAEHLKGCPRCRAVGQMILEGERGLGEAMMDLVPVPDLDDLMDRAERERDGGQKGIRHQLRWSLSRLAPLAAAAALVALFFGREPVLPGDPVVHLPPAPGLGLEVPEGQDVAVLATSNPDITVLWFF